MTVRELEERLRRLEQTVASMAVLLSAYLGPAVVKDLISHLGRKGK